MTQNINAQQIAKKQIIALIIDFVFCSSPLILLQNLTGAYISFFLWYLYIPFCEYFFSQTIGMKIMNTKIYGTSEGKISKLSLGAVLRRNISRISILWGVVGWLYLLFNNQLGDDYVIVYKNYSSTDISTHPKISNFGFRFSFATVSKVLYIFFTIDVILKIVFI